MHVAALKSGVSVSQKYMKQMKRLKRFFLLVFDFQ